MIQSQQKNPKIYFYLFLSISRMFDFNELGLHGHITDNAKHTYLSFTFIAFFFYFSA